MSAKLNATIRNNMSAWSSGSWVLLVGLMTSTVFADLPVPMCGIIRI